MKHRILQVLWPAFLVAGALEVLLFAAVDPGEVRWFGSLLGWNAIAVYSVVFLVLWFLVALAGALTVLLRLSAQEINASQGRPPGP